MKKLRGILVRITISVGSLGLLFYAARGKLLDSLVYLENMNFTPLVAAVLVYLASLFIVSERLRTILRVHSIKLPILRLYYLWVISLFFNLFLPSAVGGDVAKAYYIYKDSGRKLESVSSVLVDRFLGLMATIMMAVCAFLLVRDKIKVAHLGTFLIWVFGSVLIGAFFVMSRRFSTPSKNLMLKIVPSRFKDKVNRFFDELALYHTKKKAFLLGFVYSLLAQCSFISIVFLLSLTIHIDLPYGLFFVLVPLVTLCSMIPSLGGLGVREASLVYLFQTYITMESAVAFSLVVALFIYGTGAACGILYAFRGGASLSELESVRGSVIKGDINDK
jgi:glycosyltransferase 2 family protein